MLEKIFRYLFNRIIEFRLEAILIFVFVYVFIYKKQLLFLCNLVFEINTIIVVFNL